MGATFPYLAPVKFNLDSVGIVGRWQKHAPDDQGFRRQRNCKFAPSHAVG